ncbi:pyridoxal phosphate-dependent aminotransferase [Gracilibacillus xinjiangensis]|uniref:Pyridoxal phosphate-dependent aminotransferase n=1 Tax=Gracilibacillus xinjiangensis TaxID=1193282 RepID=A0ABV8WQ11_9BACI
MHDFESSDLLNRLPEQFFAALVKKAKKLENEGHNVINLGQGNPDLPTPAFIVEALKAASENTKFHKYPPFQGYPFLKEAIARFYEDEYGVMVDPATEVAILFGAKTGLVEVSQCLLNKGDKVLVPDPGYPDYMSGIAIAHAEPVYMPLLEENDFLPDYAQFDHDKLTEAKLLFLNYPNNPTAAMATTDFFDQTVALAKNHQICVVHDFAYGAIGYDGVQAPSFLQTKGAKDIGIEIYTLSKTFNMAGWRVAFAVGNKSVIRSLELIQDHYYVSIFGAIQYAAQQALLHGKKAINENIQIYEQRRNTFLQKAEAIGWKGGISKGSFFVWMPVPDGYSSEQFANILLEKAHVVVAPGNGFGTTGEGYVRVALLDEESNLVKACERIKHLQIFKRIV